METITIKMCRSHTTTPWGFRLSAPHNACQIVPGSLADRAGIQDGDVLIELQGQAVAREDLDEAERELETSNSLELLLQRHGTSAPIRAWKPSIDLDSEMSRFQHSVHNMPMPTVPQPPPPSLPTVPVKVHLEHQHRQPSPPPIPGFNAHPIGYGTTPTGNVRHLQYNSPINVYSPSSVAEAYLQQTGGLFGTDPKLLQPKNQPSFLNSETLRLIQEAEANKARGHIPTPIAKTTTTPAPPTTTTTTRITTDSSSSIPMCQACGRKILGAMCRVGDQVVHGHCFSCSTCGTVLNAHGGGYQLVNDKFYCDVHGRQLRGLMPNSLRPEMAMRSSPTAPHPIRPIENVKAFYQPEIMARGPLQTSPIPFASRGLPSSQQYNVETDLRSNLPADLRSVTSPRRHVTRRALAWPPPSTLNCTRYWHLEVANQHQRPIILTLSDFVRQVDDEKKKRRPSPKRDLLRQRPSSSPPRSIRRATEESSENIHSSPRSTQKAIEKSPDNIHPSPPFKPTPTRRMGTSKDEHVDHRPPHLIFTPATTVLTEHVDHRPPHLIFTPATTVLTESDVDELEQNNNNNNNNKKENRDESADELQLISDWSDEQEEQFILNKKWPHHDQLNIDIQPDEQRSQLAESDKQMAIEAIERHQRSLQDQQDQLSQLLDNAILFLRKLDAQLVVQDSNQPSPRGQDSCKVSPQVQDSNQPSPQVSPRIAASVAEQDSNQPSPQVKDSSKVSPQVSPRIAPTVAEQATTSRSPSKHLDASGRIARRLAMEMMEDDNHHDHTRSQRTTTTHSTWEPRRSETDGGHGGHGGGAQAQLMTEMGRVPFCEQCKTQIRGPYVLAQGLAWCPEHFTCANSSCNRRLVDVGFVEDGGKKYCERCFEQLIAPRCNKCHTSITGDCLNALQQKWHPSCFVCHHCAKPFGNSAFFLEQGAPYCEKDWNDLFTTKCISCKFPIEAGDRWVEALGAAFHSNCFNCTKCNVNLEGQSFYAKNGQPYCKAHA